MVTAPERMEYPPLMPLATHQTAHGKLPAAWTHTKRGAPSRRGIGCLLGAASAVGSHALRKAGLRVRLQQRRVAVRQAVLRQPLHLVPFEILQRYKPRHPSRPNLAYVVVEDIVCPECGDGGVGAGQLSACRTFK